MTVAEDGKTDAQPSDEQLLSLVASGDETALGALYDRFGGLAFGLAYRVLGERGAAEDVVQEAFLSVWRRAATFQPGRGSARTWLLSVIHHRAIDRARNATGRAAHSAPLEEVDRLVSGDDPWSEVETTLLGETLRGGLGALPPEQRQTIELAYFEGCTQSQIAGRMGVPLGTVKGRTRMALRKLRELLDRTVVEYR